MSPIEPAALADAIIAHDASLLMLDIGAQKDSTTIPGAYALTDSAAAALLSSSPASSRVVVIDQDGSRHATPAGWPAGFAYHYLKGGAAAWKAEVLTPAVPASFDAATRERAARQRDIAAYFSGSGVAAPPPPTPTGGAVGGGGKKKQGGC